MGSGRGNDSVFSKVAITQLHKIAAERSLNRKVLEDDTLFQQYIDSVSFSSKFTDYGIEMEELARNHFANQRLVSIEQVGSCRHEEIENYAASPDGIFYEDGKKKVLEIKCLKPEVFMEYLTSSKDWDALKSINADYYYQVNAEIDCCCAYGACFVVFNPFLTPNIVIFDLDRNDDTINAIHERIELAEEYINTKILKL